MFTQILQSRLATYQQAQLYRQRRILETPQNIQAICDGKNVISFCSNDYLGLANHPKMIAAINQGTKKYGVGSGASQLIAGHSSAHRQFEEAFAEFLGREKALLFSSGFMANIGVISALMKHSDTIFQDKYNHASLLDAVRLSQAKLIRYPHLNTKDLQKKLTPANSGNQLIITESVFSMDGQIAPLTELVSLANKHHSWLMVDDAHGIGVLGKHGRGVTEHFSITQTDVPILVSTLGKALGCFGAVVTGSHELIENLIQFARSYIYTTAIPPMLAYAALTSLQILQTEAWRREKLFYLIDYFKTGALKRGLKFLDSQSPIQSFIIGNATDTNQISEQLFKRGFWATAIRPPTVPANTSRLRVTLNCMHEEKHLDNFLDNLTELYVMPAKAGIQEINIETQHA